MFRRITHSHVALQGLLPGDRQGPTVPVQLLNTQTQARVALPVIALMLFEGRAPRGTLGAFLVHYLCHASACQLHASGQQLQRAFVSVKLQGRCCPCAGKVSLALSILCVLPSNACSNSKTWPCAGGYNYPIYNEDDRLIIGNRDEATVQCDQACQEVSKNQTLCVDNMVRHLPTPRWPAMRLSSFKMALPSAHVRPVAYHCMTSVHCWGSRRAIAWSLRVPEGPTTCTGMSACPAMLACLVQPWACSARPCLLAPYRSPGEQSPSVWPGPSGHSGQLHLLSNRG